MDDINIMERPNSLTFDIVIIGSTKVTHHKYAILNSGIEAGTKIIR